MKSTRKKVSSSAKHNDWLRPGDGAVWVDAADVGNNIFITLVRIVFCTCNDGDIMIVRIRGFGNSVFAEMTALAREFGAVNLGQGFPDFDTPEDIKQAAMKALADGHNQYAVSHGEPVLREAIARHAARFYNQHIDANKHVCVTSGASEALWCSIFATIEPGDEVIVFEPAFDVYIPNLMMAGAVMKPVTLYAPDFRFNRDELRAAFSGKTKAIMINTPHNPTGTVFTTEELEFIRDLCIEFDVLAISDEVYEHIVFAPHNHVRIATLSGMENRCITISSGGKTFSCTGWKCGWAIASEELITAIRRVHQFTVFAGATPFHYAIAYALDKEQEFYYQLTAQYTKRRDYLYSVLQQTPLTVFNPEGAYFITADISGITAMDGVEFSKWLIKEHGVAVIPSQKFYCNEERGKQFIRFCFCKQDETLQLAAQRLSQLTTTP
ncbi:MAG: methionine aminotransferase [Candidatus Kapaibacterium sp.]